MTVVSLCSWMSLDNLVGRLGNLYFFFFPSFSTTLKSIELFILNILSPHVGTVKTQRCWEFEHQIFLVL